MFHGANRISLYREKAGSIRISFREACRNKLLRSDLQRVHGLLPAIFIEEAELILSVSAVQGFSFELTMNWKFVFSLLAKSGS